MQFETIHKLLQWFVNREYLVGPKPPGNHSCLFFGHGGVRDDPQTVFETYQKIRGILLENLSFSNRYVVMESYNKRGWKLDIAEYLRCSPRTVSRRKYKALGVLEPIFREKKITITMLKSNSISHYF